MSYWNRRSFDKGAILTELRSLGIVEAVAEYDGSGDEGWVEQVTIRYGDAHAPESEDGDEETIREFTSNVLESTHCGWEINEGSFGQVVFDVANDSIRVEHNERYEESRYEQSNF